MEGFRAKKREVCKGSRLAENIRACRQSRYRGAKFAFAEFAVFSRRPGAESAKPAEFAQCYRLRKEPGKGCSGACPGQPQRRAESARAVFADARSARCGVDARSTRVRVGLGPCGRTVRGPYAVRSPHVRSPRCVDLGEALEGLRARSPHVRGPQVLSPRECGIRRILRVVMPAGKLVRSPR